MNNYHLSSSSFLFDWNQSPLSEVLLPPDELIREGQKGAKRKRSDEVDIVEESPESKRFRSEEQEAIPVLPSSINPYILDVYQDESFLQKEKLDFTKEGTSLSEEQWQIFIALIGNGHSSTFRELQEGEEFRRAVKQRLEQDSLSEEETFLREALDEFEQYPFSFKAEEGFLQTLLMIARTRESIMNPEKLECAIENGEIEPSLHYHNVVKLKGNYSFGSDFGVDSPYTVAFNRTTGKVAFLQKPLAQGGFKGVKSVLLFTSNPAQSQQLAVGKQIREIHRAKKEIALLERCQGEPNVAQLVSHYTYMNKNNDCVVVTIAPFYEGGDLCDFVRSQRFAQLSPKHQLAIAKDIMRGTLNIHKHAIIHNDLKLENIFLTHDKDETGHERLIALVGDFGLAYEKNHPTRGGTVEYSSPEKLEGKTKGEPEDAWALGVILSLCFHGRYPYDLPHNPPKERLASIIYSASKALQATPPPEKSTHRLDWLIWGLTRPDPNERLSIKQAMREIEKILN